MKAATQGLINTGALLFIMVFGSQSYASVHLDDLLNARRSIVQLNAKEENTRRTIDKNKSIIENLNKKIAKIDIDVKKAELKIRNNEEGRAKYLDQIEGFQIAIEKSYTQKKKLIHQRKKYINNISTLQDENNDLSIIGKKYKIDSASKSRRFENLKRSYLRGDKSVCLRLAVEKAKRSAADKYAPTNITSEIESRNFEITAESSSQYYSVDIRIIKEFKSESWYKTNNDAERVEAQFKGTIRITPAFTNKTRLKLKDRFTVKLNGQLGQVTAMDVPTIAPAVRYTSPQDNLQHERELLKNDRLEAERQRDLKRQAEVARRQQEEQGLLGDRAAKQAQEETFIPPVF